MPTITCYYSFMNLDNKTKINLNYLDILKEEFKARLEANARYSMRAYARDLGISPSRLSEIFKGKGNLSKKSANLIAKKLNFSKDDQLFFLALVTKDSHRMDIEKQMASRFINSRTSNNFRSLDIDQFKIISSWEHFAILSAMELDLYDGTISFLSKKLSIPREATSDALIRLENLGAVDLIEEKFYLSQEGLTTTHDIASIALRKSHIQSLNQAIKSIDKTPVKLRDISSMTMAIDIEKLPQAKELITKFRRELCAFMEKDKKNEVYNLNIQLVPVKGEENENL